MKVKKLLTFLFSLALTSSLVFMSGCDLESFWPPKNWGQENENVNGDEEIEGGEQEEPIDPMEGVETLTEIPASNITITSIAKGTATSSWFIEYGEDGLEVTVYTSDATICATSGNVYDNDHVEIIVDKAQEAFGYSETTTSVSVDVLGGISVINLVSEVPVSDSGVTANVKKYTIAGEKPEGWYAEISIPYTIAGIDKANKDALVYLGMTNADGGMDLAMSYYEFMDAKYDSVKTYPLLSANNAFERNPYYYERIDGVILDGEKDEVYGDFEDTVFLNGNRQYSISAVKTESGVVIYTQALFNTTSASKAEKDWGLVTNFEFTLNEGETSYVTFNALTQNVTKVFTSVETVENGKYLHTAEFFVEKDLITDWSKYDYVQLNYGWKSPNEKALMISDMIDCRYTDWDTDTHNYQRLGGLSSYEFDGELVSAPRNLLVTVEGLKTTNVAPVGEGLPVVDGNLTEYGNAVVCKGDSNKATVAMNGKVVDGNLYLGLTITHGAWAEYSMSWWLNDNIEMQIFDLPVRIVFLNGELILPWNVTAGEAITVAGDNGKQITTVELCFAFHTESYELRMGIAGNGFGGWQSILWDSGDCAYVTESGLRAGRSIEKESGVMLDGVHSESLWTETVRENSATAEANGATVSVIGTKLTNGVLFGVTVKHTKAPEQAVANSTEWWAYMGVEFHINGNETAHIATCLNGRSEKVIAYCNTVENLDGTYTSTFEVYILYTDLGVTESDELKISVGGWFETDWAWLWGGNGTTSTHRLTVNGLEIIV